MKGWSGRALRGFKGLLEEDIIDSDEYKRMCGRSPGFSYGPAGILTPTMSFAENDQVNKGF